MKTTRTWSNYQLAIFRDVAEGDGHTVVLARAGTGKTTTIMEALCHVPKGKSTLVCAFNKSIEKELAARVQSAGLAVDVKTLHGFGFGACMRAFKSRLDQDKAKRIAVDILGDDEDRIAYRNEVCKAVSLSKGMLLDTVDAIDNILDVYGIESGDDRDQFCSDVYRIMDACYRMTGVVDFDDMIWIPVVHGLAVKQYDRVFVDETQDLNAAQIELSMMACRKGGRICAVGDDRQAIYGFRGADSRAIPNIIERLSAKVLPLSVTYRCARKIVELAQTIVPDYEVAPGAEEGTISVATSDAMIAQAKPGDFILSRKNAPLIKNCLALLVNGTPAAIQGRDIGKNLTRLIDKSKAKTVPALVTWIGQWAEKEIRRITAKRPDADVQPIVDTAACIEALTEGESSVSSVKARVEALFSDTDERGRVTLSTTHKAKGLERDRAWILVDTYRPSAGEEEANLYYVAITRAKSALFMVSDPKDE